MTRCFAIALGLVGLLAAPLLAQPAPVAAPEEVGLSAERLQRIDDVFQSYVDEGRIAGAVGMVLRHDRLAYAESWGMRDIAAGDPMETDDIFRIYSMTKPITSVAVMMLYEEGHFLLTDPVARFLPELADLRVARLEEATSPEDIPTEPARRPVTIQDLLRHTSGITYGVFTDTPVDQLYRERDILDQPTLEDVVDRLGELPLMYQPGERWNYSVSTDVLARLVEVVSGRSFDVFLEERIFEPLGMDDTGFYVPASKRDRFARTYGHSASGRTLELGDTTDFVQRPTNFSGSGGLVSTAPDYARFARMLLNGGKLDGVRILGPKTVELMTVDHLGDAGTGWLPPGWGFGLGFAVKKKAGLDGMPGSVGTYHWFGYHGTSFWVDPEEDLIGLFMVQINPNRDVTFRRRFRSLVYQSIIGSAPVRPERTRGCGNH